MAHNAVSRELGAVTRRFGDTANRGLPRAIRCKRKPFWVLRILPGEAYYPAPGERIVVVRNGAACLRDER